MTRLDLLRRRLGFAAPATDRTGRSPVRPAQGHGPSFEKPTANWQDGLSL
jgi:hypothetical protein